MLNEMKKYGGQTVFKQLLQQFFEEVTSQRAIRHYFFNVVMEKMIEDQINYSQYILRKPDRAYLDGPMQSSTPDIRVSPNVFDDVLITLQNLLTKRKFAREDVNRIASKILDVCEETRSQANDTNIMMLKAVDVSIENLIAYYEKNKTDARIDNKMGGEVYTSRGTTYPFWSRLDTDKKTITLVGRAFANDPGRVAQLEAIKNLAVEKIPFFPLEVRATPAASCIYSEYTFSYALGVPTRLLMRCARDFSSLFYEVLKVDRDEELRNLTR